MKKPTIMLMIANPGVARGDPRKPATVDQSRAVTESFHIYPANEGESSYGWKQIVGNNVVSEA